jgi:hypothetical protein
MTRRVNRLMALAALVAWTTAAVGPAFGLQHDSIVDDVACGETLLGHPHPRAQFERVLPPVTDGHCEVCHLQRGFRHASTLGLSTLVQPVESAAVPWESSAAPGGVATAHLPARAPPAAL